MSPRVAIVGAGPAGFYAAELLLAKGLAVDMFDRLPTPFGLVRAGVAPDHPKIKSVARVYEKTAKREHFCFFGCVEVGREIAAGDLRSRYDAILYAVGTSAERGLGIPGEDLLGSEPASEFVAWYNGHPDHAEHTYDLSRPRAVVVGNGNVALDVARMLVLSPEELALTDTADHAIAAFRRSNIREVVLLGRRGPLQAAFTTPELRELGELAQADVVVDRDDLDPRRLAPAARPGEQLELDAAGRRKLELLSDYASRSRREHSPRIHLRFLVSPTEILGDRRGRVAGLRLVRNRLVAGDGARVVAEPTGQGETIGCGLVLTAVGYRGAPIPGVPFDHDRGVIPNRDGRVVDGVNRRVGEYVAGWIKRGPSGVIGTNKKCAAETVGRLLEDLAAGRLPKPEAQATERWVRTRAPDLVTWQGWRAVDDHECEAGKPHGRPRVKLVRREDLSAVAARVDGKPRKPGASSSRSNRLSGARRVPSEQGHPGGSG
jgi:ferredoxin/flavodoxin---NADP+ reductase